MKSLETRIKLAQVLVAPARERGLKLQRHKVTSLLMDVAPARERGLKLLIMILVKALLPVAPARERGLK